MTNAEATIKPTLWEWIKLRAELIVPVLGLVLFYLINGDANRPATIPVWILVGILTVVYAWLIVREPQKTPEKEPRTIEKRDIWRTLRTVAAVVIGAAMIQIMTSMSEEDTSDGSSNSLIIYLVMLVLIIGFGTAGFLAEKGLKVDLLPVIRRRDFKHILYVLAAGFFIAVVVMVIGGGLSNNIGEAVGSLFGEVSREQSDSGFMPGVGWPSLFLDMLIGAGLFEELLFRAGIMTLVWKLTKGWGWGLVVSAILFGFYHITMSSLSGYFLEAPIASVVSSAIMGLVLGSIYRYRGLTMAVLVHALTNFIGLMMFN